MGILSKVRFQDSGAILVATLLLATPALQSVAGQQAPSTGRVSCLGGFADGYRCDQVDLLSHLSTEQLGVSEALDVWGWTDPETGSEYVLAGTDSRTVFVDISVAEAPRIVGWLPHSGARESGWRDIKVHANHAYIVADNAGYHGLQVFDLTRLRDETGDPVEFTMTAHYQGFGSAHNVAVNEESGFLYVVGASGGETCGGGLHMLNVSIPDTPRFVGCFAHDGTGRADTGYTHDVQCVMYRGPDVDYQGRELCFGANETAVSISDVTVKGRPEAVAKAEYPGVAYAHQGWLTEDQRYFILGDELDEARGEPSRSLIFDVSDVDDPVLAAEYLAVERSIDHNMYVVGDVLYQTNYTAGLRILDISDPLAPFEIGHFDTTPNNEGVRFAGTWSSYPYFRSGSIAVSSIGEGLFIVQGTNPALSVGTGPESVLPERFTIGAIYPNPFNERARLQLQTAESGALRVSVVDVLGREVVTPFQGTVAAGHHEFPVDGTSLAPGTYMIRVELNGVVKTSTLTRR